MSISFLKYETGLRDELISADSCIVLQILDLAKNGNCDTITGFLERHFGLPNNSDGFTYGFGGKLRAHLFEKAFANDLCLAELFSSLSAIDPFGAAPSYNPLEEILPSISRFPIIQEIYTDTTSYYPKMRNIILNGNLLFTQQKHKHTPGFNLSDSEDGLKLLRELVSEILSTIPEKDFGSERKKQEVTTRYLNSIKFKQ